MIPNIRSRTAIDDEQDRLSCVIGAGMTIESAIAMLGASDYPGAKMDAGLLDEIRGRLVEMADSLWRSRKHRVMKKSERKFLDITHPGWDTAFQDNQDPDLEDARD